MRSGFWGARKGRSRRRRPLTMIKTRHNQLSFDYLVIKYNQYTPRRNFNWCIVKQMSHKDAPFAIHIEQLTLTSNTAKKGVLKLFWAESAISHRDQICKSLTLSYIVSVIQIMLKRVLTQLPLCCAANKLLFILKTCPPSKFLTLNYWTTLSV